MNLFLKNYLIYTFSINVSWISRYAIYHGLENDVINVYYHSYFCTYHDSIRSCDAKISTSTQTEIANFSGLLGRVLTEMRLVKVSNTERLELDNAHTNLKKFIA